jgi:hypothetical protein
MWDASDIALGGRAVGTLAGGAGSTASTTVTVPAGTAAGGWYVICRVDATNALQEVSEVNNTTARWMQITASQ